MNPSHCICLHYHRFLSCLTSARSSTTCALSSASRTRDSASALRDRASISNRCCSCRTFSRAVSFSRSLILRWFLSASSAEILSSNLLVNSLQSTQKQLTEAPRFDWKLAGFLRRVLFSDRLQCASDRCFLRRVLFSDRRQRASDRRWEVVKAEKCFPVIMVRCVCWENRGPVLCTRYPWKHVANHRDCCLGVSCNCDGVNGRRALYLRKSAGKVVAPPSNQGRYALARQKYWQIRPPA